MLDLILAAREGDRSALSRLLAAIEPSVMHQIAQRLQTESRTEVRASDLAQEVSIDLARDLRSFRGATLPEFWKWLQAIVNNTVIDAVRKRRPPESLDQTDPGGGRLKDALGDTGTSPTAHARRMEAAETIRSAFRKLKREHREVLELRYIKEKGIAEIAAILRIKENAVHQRIFRAMKAVRPYLDGKL